VSDVDAATIALCVARGDREGARFASSCVDDVPATAWWSASEIVRNGVPSGAHETAWGAAVQDETDAHAIVDDDVLDLAER
jgi:hypothetical protein